MKVLVTGSTGFIGAHLCRALISKGCQVRAFHRASSARRLLDGLPVEHAIGDLTRPETLQAALAGMDVVFHTAALLGGREEPGKMYAVTVEGTRFLIQAALQAGIKRMVHTSSVAALGVPERIQFNVADQALLNENHTWNYRPDYWPYGYAKYLAELEIQKAITQGLDAVIVNPALVIGAGDIYRQNSSIIVQVARQRLPALIDGGINLVHIDDVVAGHLAALERGRCGERYILGGENLTHIQVVHKIAKIVGVKAPRMVLPTGLVRKIAGISWMVQPFLDTPLAVRQLHLAGLYFYYDTSKARVKLGLTEPKPSDHAIEEAYAWFIKSGALAENQLND